MIFSFPVAIRASLRAPSFASAPLVEKKVLLISPGVTSARSLARRALGWVAKADAEGYLDRIYEKPTEETIRALGSPIFVSMNCWLFSPAIFTACRSIAPSARGELELTDAVQYSIDRLNERYKVLAYRSPVLDMSSRSDIAAVAEKLRDFIPAP